MAVDVAGKRLLHEGHRIEADVQQVELLIALIAAYPELVTKEQLIERVWGGPYVSEAALHKTVSTLRRTLRKHGLEQAIETRHRRGYQLGMAPELLRKLPPPAAVDETSLLGTRSRQSVAMSLVIATLVIAAMVWWVPRIERAPAAADGDESPSSVSVDADPVSDEPGPVAAQHRERLNAMDDAGLVETIRTMLFNDPTYAREAIAVLRQRYAESEQITTVAALAEKYDGILYYRAGEFAPARERYLDALERFRTLGDRLEESNVLNNLAVLMAEQGSQMEDAERLYRESLRLREALGAGSSVMASHRNLANLLLQMGVLDRAETAVQAYAAAAERDGSAVDLAEATILLGDVKRERGEDPMPRYSEAAAQAVAAGLPTSAATAEQRMGDQLMRAADYIGARDAFRRSIALYEQGDARHQLPWLLYPLGNALEQLGDDPAALREYQRAVSMSEGLSDTSLLVDLRIGMSRLLSRRGDAAAARAQLDEAWRTAAAVDNPLTTVSVRTEQANQSLLSGHIVAARGHLASGFAALGEATSWPHEARLRDISILVAIAAGDGQRAERERGELERRARSHGDASMVQRSQTLQGWAALAEGRFADAYRQLDRVSPRSFSASAGQSMQPPAALPVRPTGWLLSLGMLLVGLLVGAFMTNALRA